MISAITSSLRPQLAFQRSQFTLGWTKNSGGEDAE